LWANGSIQFKENKQNKQKKTERWPCESITQIHLHLLQFFISLKAFLAKPTITVVDHVQP